MAPPSVSILVPTYNGERYLAACLDSVLAQTHRDWELVIVDDCSTDASLEIAQGFARREPRVRVVRNAANLGLVANWNRCVELANGTWVKFVFQDDLIEPTCIEEMLDAAGERSKFIACRREFLFEDGTSRTDRAFYTEHPSVTALSGATEVSAETICEKAIDLLGVNFIGEPSAVLLRRDVFNRFGMFNPDLIMICDTEYWVRVGSRTGLTYVPRTLCRFRVHAGSASARNFASRRYRITLDVVLLLCEFAFREDYAKLRNVAASRVPPVDFRDLLRAKLAKASNAAAGESDAHEGSDPMVEWTDFLQAHPRISEMLADKEDHPGLLHRLSDAVSRAAHKVAG